MELLKLLLYTTAFTQLSYSHFFDFCLINIFLLYIYYTKPVIQSNTFDFMVFTTGFIHLALHVMFYYLQVWVQICKSNQYANQVITKYNYLNEKYLELRFKFFYHGVLRPVKFIVKKILLSNTPPENYQEFNEALVNFRQSIVNSVKKNQQNANGLKTNEQIDDFLNKILEDNKKQ